MSQACIRAHVDVGTASPATISTITAVRAGERHEAHAQLSREVHAGSTQRRSSCGAAITTTINRACKWKACTRAQLSSEIHAKSTRSQHNWETTEPAMTLTLDSTDHLNTPFDASCVVVQTTAITHTETGVASRSTDHLEDAPIDARTAKNVLLVSLMLLRFFFVPNRPKGARQSTNRNTRIPQCSRSNFQQSRTQRRKSPRELPEPRAPSTSRTDPDQLSDTQKTPPVGGRNVL